MFSTILKKSLKAVLKQKDIRYQKFLLWRVILKKVNMPGYRIWA
jgi:hypothetical protein